MRWKRWVSFAILSLAVPLAARPAAAQLAPTGGHYANQPSDTGFTGGVDSSGGYSASVPLDVPAARNGLPVPVSIVYGGGRVGAAGLGWDVPLSYIVRDNTIAHRRPKVADTGSPQAREAVSLVLEGRSMDLVRTGSDWVPRRNAPDILVRQQSDSNWVVFDGQGRTYSFTVVTTTGGVSMWLLRSITGAGGSKVELDYSITNPTVPGGGGLAIDLTNVSYNPHPTTVGCFKNSVALVYDADVSPALSMSVLGERILVRTHKLVTVDVKSKATCSDAYARLRSYQLDYTQDVDTKQPRLLSVKVAGREGTPEATKPIPLGTYGYGTATSSGQLQYTLSGHANSGAFTQPYTEADTVMGTVFGFRTLVALHDLSGDGLPDVIDMQDMFPDWLHSTKFVRLTDGDRQPDPAPEVRGLRQARYLGDGNVEDLWVQAIDVNGDGRIDRVFAHEVPGHWLVYLNMPDPKDPSHPLWQKRTYSIQGLVTQLLGRGFSIDPPGSIDLPRFLPLARRTTERQIRSRICWHWSPPDFEWVGDPGGFPAHCPGAPRSSSELTFTEWELTDINGDGYPDMVFDSSPVFTEHISEPDPEFPPEEDRNKFNLWTVTEQTFTPRLSDGNEIEAVFNVLGVQVATDSQPFSAPVTLRSADTCGVARWRAVDASHQSLSCDIADVNGDGIPDRVVGTSVFLGKGTLTAGGFFTSDAQLTLPGALAAQVNDQVAKCEPPATSSTAFVTYQTAALRDLTGDGIPDYVTADGNGPGTVQIGTGTAFLNAVPINGMFMALSRQIEDCGGKKSTTTTGLYDVDGDGKPEVLTSDENVYTLTSNGAVGAYAAGRLVTIDNGFGARTTITYGSAKVPAATNTRETLHQVPFPEIVVTSVETTRTQSPGETLLAKTQYAYGGAQLIFDAALDKFRFPGYLRQVALRVPTEQTEGLATITDTYGPSNPADPFAPLAGSTAEQRYARLLRFGRVSDVTVLAGNLGSDPSSLLAIDANSDGRRIANTHYDYGARLLPAASSAPEKCNEMVRPYDYQGSKDVSDPDASDAAKRVDACLQRGFAFTISVQSVRGEQGASPSSGATVTTRSEVQSVDDFGRATRIKELGDVSDTTRTDDDLCIDIAYATPNGTNERVLSAVRTRTVGDCTTATIYAKDTWQYDQLPIGSVSAGLPTAHLFERHDETGAPLGEEVHERDWRYTPEGNLLTMSTEREDHVVRSVNVQYDDFALAPTILAVTGNGVPKLRVDLTRDPFTLNVTNTRDSNFTLHGTRFDGFDRPFMTTVTPTGGTEGALSCTSYQGFDGTSTDGRSVTATVFTNPIPLAMACTATGRTATVHLDELGRPRLTEQVLGANYPGVVMKADQTYDSLGRLLFATDPYPSTQDPVTAYGTTQYWNADGTPLCFIRGQGKQQRPAPPTNSSDPPMVTNEASERYPMCFSRHFVDHVEVLSVQDAASLLSGSPQASVVKSSYLTAAGRLLARATWQGSDRLEYATFTQDRLGHLASMTRYKDAAAGSNPVTSSWRTDSLGQLLELDEPDAAAQLNTYSNWGELLETTRTANGTVKRTVQKYDAYGRLIHSEQQTGRVVDPETVRDFAYDTAVQVVAQVTARNVLGRLAQATWPTGSVTFSYDGLGRNNAQVFTDPQRGHYVEKHTFLGDGSLDLLELFLPDTAFADEQIKYNYDSAGRGTTVTYKNGDDQRELYSATTIDPFGRVRAAKYGQADYTADYNDLGRRLMTQVAVSSNRGSRTISYGTFDPVGRERSRTELKNGSGTSTSTSWAYDALGRLSTADKTRGGVTLLNQAFTYDPLGNLLTMTHIGSEAGINATLSYSATDPDRISCITFGSGSSPPCEVRYDELGSIRSQPTPTGTREYTYLVDGSVRTVNDDHGSKATFRYDAFGQVQELDVDLGPSSTSTDARRDRHYGSLITLRQESIDSAPPQSVYTRKIPLHDGSIATRHGAGGPWTFEYGEARGNRFFTDQNGAFVQDADYQPFGMSNPSSTDAQPGSQRYSSKQWNFGDSLAALGLSQLGARLYDPAIGRFTRRDPLLIPRTAATTNPYAFADNDPVNASDPSGLQPATCATYNPVCIAQSYEPAPTGGSALQPTPPTTEHPPPDFARWESVGRKVIPGDPWDGGQPSGSAHESTHRNKNGIRYVPSGSPYPIVPITEPVLRNWVVQTGSRPIAEGAATFWGGLLTAYHVPHAGHAKLVADLTPEAERVVGTAFDVGVRIAFAAVAEVAVAEVAAAGFQTEAGVENLMAQGTRTFSRGSGGVAKISLDEARAAAQANGIDMRMFELAYEPGPHFGFMSQLGTGALWRAPNGRILLTLQDAGLASARDAVETIAHELNHIRGVFATGAPSSEASAESAAEAVRQFFR